MRFLLKYFVSPTLSKFAMMNLLLLFIAEDEAVSVSMKNTPDKRIYLFLHSGLGRVVILVNVKIFISLLYLIFRHIF